MFLFNDVLNTFYIWLYGDGLSKMKTYSLTDLSEIRHRIRFLKKIQINQECKTKIMDFFNDPERDIAPW